jgi:hypothetical protein
MFILNLVNINAVFQNLKQGTTNVILILDFRRGVDTDFWFWGFCSVCEVNFSKTLRESLWILSSLVMSQNINDS